jgi:hypothetical protein
VINKFRAERLECARSRGSALVALIDTLGVDVDAEAIQRAALIALSPAGVQATFNVAVLALIQMDTLAAILAGCCDEGRIAMLANMSWPESTPKVRPRRPRRSRPAAAERDHAAAAWLLIAAAAPATATVDLYGFPRDSCCTARAPCLSGPSARAWLRRGSAWSPAGEPAR